MEKLRRRPRAVSMEDKYDAPYNFRIQRTFLDEMRLEAGKRGIAVSELIRLAVEKEMKQR